MMILLQLLIAHILTDFVLQPGSWIAHKRKFKQRSYLLIIHSLIAGVLSVVLLQNIQFWYVGLFITITHYFIDWWKLTQKEDTLKYFLLDQLFHVGMIMLAWLYISNNFNEILPGIQYVLNSTAILAIISVYLIVIFPTGFLIGKATKRWQSEIEITHQKNSLEAAGRYIGIFERILVLTFILTNNFSAIGFLIAAKSILRFSEKSETGARKQTEYVLIGTLMSFAITIILGLLVRNLIF
ncbi:DUF3307 domain-containing protein [Gillisia sp. Hel1_33_143]|uniref:DUF3307 domain-containing protein n=1 Tax=Gillisia sp. Hel1_33_143 TaxID=1336796 RepID=UPI000B89E2C5|nr:DUF3307 domain-containing protein [Gillisia sp. Hel1_33_143]